MGVIRALTRLVPSSLRRYCRDLIDTDFRGVRPALLHLEQSELSLNLDMVLSHYRVDHSKICYLQVGAFDGVAGDPVYPLIERHGLRGILIEPQHDAFLRLKENYSRFGESAFKFVNAAIASDDGSSILYRIKPEARGPEWLHQIASFDRNVLMKHASMVSNLESLVQAEEVRCVTFATVFKEVGIEHVDMLQIDAEGYDAEILRLFNIGARKPAIVQFEHKHLTVLDHKTSVKMLIDQGYKVTACGNNTLAYLEQKRAPAGSKS